MIRFNFQSVLFAVIVLIFVLWARVHRDDFARAPLDKKIASSSLQASMPATSYKSPPQTFDADRVMALSSSPTKKWDAPEPNIKAAAALIKDLNSGTKLLELNTYKHWPLASLTKLMTTVIALEQIGADKHISMSEEAIATEGVAVGFSPGDVFTVADLVKSMLVVSSNDAAATLAEFYGAENFFDAMQQKAADLGMSQTSFFDSTGLSFLNQSSIGDLEKLVDYILKNKPEIFNVSRQKETIITETNSKTEKILFNINSFAGADDFLGGKTGFIDEASGNLISIFQYKNRPLLIIILGAGDRVEETKKLYQWVKEAYNL